MHERKPQNEFKNALEAYIGYNAYDEIKWDLEWMMSKFLK
jgi:hypothetical protein